MASLRLPLQLVNKVRSSSVPTCTRLRANASASASLRRSFRSSACRREQFLDADQATFLKATSKEHSQGKVVLVDFYADWCGPCKMLSPILEEITAPGTDLKSGSGKPVDLVTVDTDAEQELAVKYQIRSIPTVIAFKDGEPVQKFAGALPKPQVIKFIESL